jgi:hypothetical protein
LFFENFTMTALPKWFISACCVIIIAPQFSSAQAETKFIKIPGGMIIYPSTEFPGRPKAVKLQVINDKIIRVIASPQKEFPAIKSLHSRGNQLQAWIMVHQQTWNLIKED